MNSIAFAGNRVGQVSIWHVQDRTATGASFTAQKRSVILLCLAYVYECMYLQGPVRSTLELAALQPAGQGRPPRCRATGHQGPVRKYFRKIFAQKSLLPRRGATRSRPPDSGAAGYILVNFENKKNIFVKTKLKNIKKKPP